MFSKGRNIGRKRVKKLYLHYALPKKCPYSKFSGLSCLAFGLNAEYHSVSSPTAEKYGTEKLRIGTGFTHPLLSWNYNTKKNNM